jgi:hypothetical protein
LPARWSRRDERNVAILAGLLRREEVEMPFESAGCHQISTRKEAQTVFDYLETGTRARLDFPLVGLVLPVAGVPVAVKIHAGPAGQGPTTSRVYTRDTAIGVLRRVAVSSQPRETRRLAERVQRHD